MRSTNYPIRSDKAQQRYATRYIVLVGPSSVKDKEMFPEVVTKQCERGELVAAAGVMLRGPSARKASTELPSC